MRQEVLSHPNVVKLHFYVIYYSRNTLLLPEPVCGSQQQNVGRYFELLVISSTASKLNSLLNASKEGVKMSGFVSRS